MSNHADKHLPRPTPLSQPWWDACRQQQLLVQRCSDCGHVQFYPRTFCTKCNSATVEWMPATGRGTVLSYTVVRQAVSPAYEPEVPYIITLVELEEGPVMMSILIGCDPDDARVGMPVEVRFEEWTHTITMPLFQPR